jgi:hypothetical protein
MAKDMFLSELRSAMSVPDMEEDENTYFTGEKLSYVSKCLPFQGKPPMAEQTKSIRPYAGFPSSSMNPAIRFALLQWNKVAIPTNAIFR